LHKLLRTFIQRFTLCLGYVCLYVFISCDLSCAQPIASLRTFNLTKTAKGLEINIEHSRPPVKFTINKTENPYRLYLNIIGSKVTFQEYENIPLEIPINYKGIRRIIVAEKVDYNMNPKETVEIMVELDRSFLYDADTQFNGQYIDLLILPSASAANQSEAMSGEKKFDPTQRLKIIRITKDYQTEKAREELDKLTQKARIELIRKESKAKVEQVRQKAKKRVDAATTIETAKKKLEAESEISALPKARQQMVDSNLYQDINMPSEVKPLLTRAKGPDVTNLQDCINIATNAYLPYKIAKDQEELAKLRVREARRAFYPAFLGEWNESDGKTVTEPYRGRRFGVQAEQPIYTGGKLMSTLKKEKLGVTIAKGNSHRIKQDLIFQVSKAYYELVLAKISLDMLERIKESTGKILEEVQAEFAIQSTTPAELLSAQASFNQVCYQVANSERAIALAKLALEKEMFTEELNVENIDYHLGRKKIDLDLDECMELAFRHRPELKVLEQTMQAAKYTQDIIKSEEMPNVSVVGTYGRSGEAFSQRELRLATEWSLMGKVKWFLGGNTVETYYKRDKVTPFKITRTDTNVSSQALNAKFSFWDNLAHFSQKKEAQITRTQAQKDYEEMKNKIRQETEDSYYSYQKYNVQLSLAINEIGYRRKQLEIAKTKRRMNEAGGADVIDAEAQLAQANSNMQQALAGINLSIASLNRAIGVINYFH
jgi:outer membrane protein TolC